MQTERASSTSSKEQQVLGLLTTISSLLYSFMVQPIHSYPLSIMILAAREESTPPLMAIKALLIFLAINGKCTIWFALFVDMAAAIGTVLNSIRVTQDSLLANLRRPE